MKKFLFAIGGLLLLLLLVMLLATGCADDVDPNPVDPTQGELDNSACITCHSNDSVLEAVAEEEEEVEAESEGEG